MEFNTQFCKKCGIKLQLTRKEEANATLTLPKVTLAPEGWVTWVKQGHDVNINLILSEVLYERFEVSIADKGTHCDLGLGLACTVTRRALCNPTMAKYEPTMQHSAVGITGRWLSNWLAGHTGSAVITQPATVWPLTLTATPHAQSDRRKTVKITADAFILTDCYRSLIIYLPP